MNESIRQFPTEPSDDSIRICDDCEIGDQDVERYLNPIRLFTMNFSQLTVPKDERTGVPSIELSLTQRGDIDIPDVMAQTGALLPRNCDKLRETSLTEDEWNELSRKGCPGKIYGRKKYLIFGQRKSFCGVLKMIEKESI